MNISEWLAHATAHCLLGHGFARAMDGHEEIDWA